LLRWQRSYSTNKSLPYGRVPQLDCKRRHIFAPTSTFNLLSGRLMLLRADFM
jgi:hypothetical protein